MGWGDSSGGKMFAAHTLESFSISSTHIKTNENKRHGMHACDSRAGEVEREASLGLTGYLT